MVKVKLLITSFMGEYELTNTSWSKLQKKYHVIRNKIYTTIKGKGRPRGSQYRQKKQMKKPIKPESTVSTPPSESVSELRCHSFYIIQLVYIELN